MIFNKKRYFVTYCIVGSSYGALKEFNEFKQALEKQTGKKVIYIKDYYKDYSWIVEYKLIKNNEICKVKKNK